MPVEFKGADDFVPVTVLSWALDRTATAEWGTAELGGVKAPEKDILGNPRTGRFDVGAVETVVKPPRAPGSPAFTKGSLSRPASR